MTKDSVNEIELMAHADGELAPERVPAIKAYLTAHPEAQKLVDDYRAISRSVSAAFEAPLNEPPPGHLVDTIRNFRAPEQSFGAHPQSDTGTEKVVEFPFWRTTGFGHTLFPSAAAAALVLAIGIGVGLQWHGNSKSAGEENKVLALGPVPQTSPLVDLLERRGTGLRVELNDGSVATVVGTFLDKSKRFCREYELLKVAGNDRSEAPIAAAVACRSSKGQWKNEGAALVANQDTNPGAHDYVPSGGDEKDVLEGLLKVLGAGTVLPVKEEAMLLEKGWKPKR